MRRIAIIFAVISLAWIPVSLTFAVIALTMGGATVLPIVAPTFALNAVMIPINILTITLNSPGRDPLHYPRRLTQWLGDVRAGLRQRQVKTVRAADPVHRAWDIIVRPPHAVTPARSSRLEDLRFRADVAIDRLTGTLDVADIEALVLLEKTLAEVAGAYAETLPTMTTDKARKDLDRRLDDTLEQMVSAAETRLAVADRIVVDRFDTAIRHAQASSARITDR